MMWNKCTYCNGKKCLTLNMPFHLKYASVIIVTSACKKCSESPLDKSWNMSMTSLCLQRHLNLKLGSQNLNPVPGSACFVHVVWILLVKIFRERFFSHLASFNERNYIFLRDNMEICNFLKIIVHINIVFQMMK
jgi:hypothetical protein